MPNPSIERTASGGLRPPPAAAHVKRWAPSTTLLATLAPVTKEASHGEDDLNIQ